MGIFIGPLEFEGPFADAEDLRDAAGIYALFTERKGEFELIELDETICVKDCLDNEEYTSNKQFWQEMSSSKLLAAVHYTPDLSREQRRHTMLKLMKEFE